VKTTSTNFVISLLLLFSLIFFFSSKKIVAQNPPNKYITGLIDKNNLAPNATLLIDIFYVDIHNYPDSVSLYCTVMDNYGNQVTNLAPPYNMNLKKHWKQVVERIGNKSFKITDFDVKEVRQDEAPAFITSFVLDYSGSMFGEISKVESALHTVQNYLRADKDYFDVVQFDHNIYNPIKNSNNPNDFNKILPFETLGGATAFYTASVFGINNIAKGKPNTKVAILFTDGMDNASLAISANTLIAKARKYGVRVFVIGYGYANNQILTQIADQTGGKAYFPHNLSELNGIFNDIYRFMKVYYVIKYKPSKNDSSIVNVEVDMMPLNGSAVTCMPTVYYPVPVELPASLSNILALFKSGSARIDDIYIPLIKNFADYLISNPDVKISLIGHSDSRGNMQTQTDISLKRVYAVYDILVKNGVNVDQIVDILGKGNDEPIHKKEEFDWQRYENNRVEVLFK